METTGGHPWEGVWDPYVGSKPQTPEPGVGQAAREGI